MEDKVNVSDEIKRLEADIGKIMVGSAQDEIGESKREITKLSSRIEELLVEQAGVPSSVAAKLVENMHERLTYDVGKQIASSRSQEYEETQANLSTVETDTPEGTLENLERFEQGGVAINNRRYGQNIEQICEEVFNEYRMRLGRINDRRVDEAVYDIKRMVSRTSGNLQEIHESYSRDIARDVAKKVGELGERVSPEIQAKIETEVEQKIEENGFMSGLQAQTVSEEEMARMDAQELSDNEKAFRGTEEPSKSNRSELEDMFK